MAALIRLRTTIALACISVVAWSSFVQAESMPTYGLSVEGPKDWQRLSRDMGKRVARWAILDAKGRLDKLIQIDSGLALDQTVEGNAASIAKQFNGTVSKEGITVDGSPALRVEAPHAGKGLQPVEVIVTSHEGLFYYMFGATATPGSLHEAVEHVRKSWKWVKRLSPSECLADRAPLTSSDLGIRVSAPRCVAIVPGVEERPSLHLALRDPLKAYDEGLILTQAPPVPPGTDFAKVTAHFRDGWNAAATTETALSWQIDDAKSKVVVSNVLMIKETPEDAKKRGAHPRNRAAWAIRQLDDKTLLLINMTIASDDPKELALYSKYLDAFVRDVEEIPRTK